MFTQCKKFSTIFSSSVKKAELPLPSRSLLVSILIQTTLIVLTLEKMFQMLSTLPVYEKSAWVFKLHYTEEENKFEWIMKTLISYHYVNKDQHCAILKSPSRNVIMQVLFSAAVTVLAPVQWLLARKSCMHINDDEGQLDQPKKPDNSVPINTIPLTWKIVVHINVCTQ